MGYCDGNKVLTARPYSPLNPVIRVVGHVLSRPINAKLISVVEAYPAFAWPGAEICC
jgi:hypothetical protein